MIARQKKEILVRSGANILWAPAPASSESEQYIYTAQTPYVVENFNDWTELRTQSWLGTQPSGTVQLCCGARNGKANSLEDNGSGGKCVRATSVSSGDGMPEILFKPYVSNGSNGVNVSDFRQYQSHGWETNSSGPSQPFNRFYVQMRFNSDFETGNAATAYYQNFHLGTYHVNYDQLPKSSNETDNFHFYFETKFRHDLHDPTEWITAVWGESPSVRRNDDNETMPRFRPMASLGGVQGFGLWDQLTYFYLSNRGNNSSDWEPPPENGYPAYMEINEIGMYYEEENYPVTVEFVGYTDGDVESVFNGIDTEFTIRLTNTLTVPIDVRVNGDAGIRWWMNAEIYDGAVLLTPGATLSLAAGEIRNLNASVNPNSGKNTGPYIFSFCITPTDDHNNQSLSPFYGPTGYRNRNYSGTIYQERRTDAVYRGPWDSPNNASAWIQLSNDGA